MSDPTVVRVTNGAIVPYWVRLSDAFFPAEDISTFNLQLALGDCDAYGGAWTDPDVVQPDGKGLRASIVVASPTPVGDYRVWYKLTNGSSVWIDQIEDSEISVR